MDQYVDQKLLEPPAKGNIPAFLTKLWKIVEDEQYDDVISWNENGTTIKILDPVNFSLKILPRFYKHNNFSSFVRQVNMYGFRKIIDVTGAKHGDGDWEFYHSYFQRDHPESIIMMKRKGQLKEDIKLNNTQFSNLLQDVEKLKNQHAIVDEKLNLVKGENERLWRDVLDLRGRHQNQQEMIVKLIQFFLQLVMNKSDRKRRFPAEKDIPEVFFEKRALHFPDGKGKKMAIQCYDSPSAALTEVFATDPVITTAQSPVPITLDQLQQVSPDATTVEVVQERHPEIFNASVASPDVPSVTLTVQAHGESSNTTSTVKPGHQSPPPSPFVFPEVYKSEPEIIDLSSCISTDESISNPILYSVKAATPDLTMMVKKLPKSAQTLSTPVVTMPPTLTRQTSFKDRDEVSTNVENISKSIETLQDILNKNGMNIDLKNMDLNSLYGDVANSASMIELFKIIHQQADQNHSSEDQETLFSTGVEDKVIPYTPKFSPSHLIDPEYGTINVGHGGNDFFNSVLDDDEDEDDDIHTEYMYMKGTRVV